MPKRPQNVPSSIAELVKSVSIQVNTSTRFSRFQRMYKNDRIAFVHDIIPDFAETIAPYQEEILGNFDDNISRVAVRGPHGLGKTTLASILTHHAVLTSEEDAKVPTTASAWRQLEKYLWPEIRKIGSMLQWTEIGREPYNVRTEFFTLSIRLHGGLVEAFAVASDDHNTIEGAHGSLLFYIFDEAKAIPRNTWNAAEGAFSTADAVILTESLKEPSKLQKDKVDEIIHIIKSGIISISPFMDPVSDKEGLVIQGINDPVEESELDEVDSPQEIHSRDMSLWDTRLATKRTPVQGKDNNKYPLYKDPVSHADLINATLYMNRLEGDQFKETGDSLLQESMREELSEESVYGEGDGSSMEEDVQEDVQEGVPSRRLTGATAIETFSHTSAHSVHKTPSGNIISRTVSRALAFAISTPGDPTGQFYDIHQRKPGYEDWHTRHVTVEEAITAGRVSAQWVLQREKQWGRYSSIFLNRCLGEFADESEEGLIPVSWVLLAINRWKRWKESGSPVVPGKRVVGVDTAWMGDDKTVLALRDGSSLKLLISFSKLANTTTAGHIKHYSQDGRDINLEVDGGWGVGTLDVLRDNGVKRINPIRVASPTIWTDRTKEMHFLNVRAAMWWNMREMLDPQNSEDVMLPNVEELKADLTAMQWSRTPGGSIRVLEKRELSKKLGRSPDYGTAVVLAFWTPSRGGGMMA